MAIRHVKTDLLADGTDTRLVRPSDWNSAHAYTLVDGVAFGGNTAGVMATVSSGTMFVAGGNNVTISQDQNSLTVVGGGMTAGVSSWLGGGGVFNTIGDTGAVASRIYVAAQGIITVSQTIVGDSASWVFNASVATPAAPVNTIYHSDLAGTTSVSGSALSFVFQGIGNAAVQMSTAAGGATVQISGSQSVQAYSGATLGVSTMGNTAGTTGQVTGGFYFVGSQNVTLSMSSLANNNATVTILGPVTVAQTNQTVGLYGSSNTQLTSSGTVDARSLTFRAAGSLTVAVSAGQVVFSAPNALTTAMLSNAATISNIKMSASGGSVLASDFTFANSNGFTFGLDTAARQFTASYTVPSVPAQTNQTVGLYASSNTYLTSSGTVDARSLSFRGDKSITVGVSAGEVVFSVGAYLTTAMGSGASTQFVQANAAFAGTNASGTIASNGISVSVAAPGGGNALTVQDSATTLAATKVVFSNANGVSFGLATAASLATVTASIATTYAGTGFTTTTAAGAVIAGTHDTAGLQLGVPAFLTTAMLSNAATISNVNLSAGTTSQNLSAFVFSNSNQVSFGLSGSTVTAAPIPVNLYEPIDMIAGTATSTGGLGTLHLMPLNPQWPVTCAQVNVIASNALSSTTAGNTMTFSIGGASSIRFGYSLSNTNSQLVDAYLFSKGTGGFTSNLQTFGSTRNSFVTFQNHSYDFSANVTAGGSGSWSLKSSVSVSVSFPGMTSGTMTSINNATTVTTWGTGYTVWTSSISTSTSNTFATSATASASLAGTWPATTAWASMKLVPLMFATSIAAGENWLGLNLGSSSSSSSSSASSNVAAGRTYTSSINGSALTMSANITYLGMTNSIINSLGYMGGNTLATMGPWQGHGSFSATYSPASTYVNNAGQANGAIAFTQISTNASFFQTWMQFANYRI